MSDIVNWLTAFSLTILILDVTVIGGTFLLVVLTNRVEIADAPLVFLDIAYITAHLIIIISFLRMWRSEHVTKHTQTERVGKRDRRKTHQR